MYNRYVSGQRTYAPVSHKEMRQPAPEQREEDPCSQPVPDKKEYIQGESGTQGSDRKSFKEDGKNDTWGIERIKDLFGRDKFGGIGSLLKTLGLEDLDTGDILLFLIILFLLSESDELELVITLGLMLLLGLGKEEKHPDEQKTSGCWEGEL